jgi:hypothetical protein
MDRMPKLDEGTQAVHLIRYPLIGLSLLIAAAGALAEGAAPAERFEARVDARQAQQQQRIATGVASGELTPAETRHLLGQQRSVARHEQRIEADGRITRREAFGLERHLDRSSRHIYHQKHDRQSRGG